jgi:hypothetical protein
MVQIQVPSLFDVSPFALVFAVTTVLSSESPHMVYPHYIGMKLPLGESFTLGRPMADNDRDERSLMRLQDIRVQVSKKLISKKGKIFSTLSGPT